MPTVAGMSVFFRDSLINTQPIVTVVVWWLVIILLGWAAFPILFAMFPSLADRGYGASKFAGMMLLGWFAWFMTSLRVPLWSLSGLWLSFGLMTLLGVYLARTHWEVFRVYVQQYWWRMLFIELVTLAAFLFFLGVRLSNPDLWHPAFGGEKPMDFAYFNGVLRSTTFPPIDPWHAGGFINYYYFGFVMVGAPVLMLGVVPSIAYNLIIPTLFALTGIGAFSVAFNIVAGVPSSLSGLVGRLDQRSNLKLTGSAWTAGIAALLLAVVLGNLNTPRVFVNGLARLGGYDTQTSVSEFLFQEYRDEFGEEPSGDALVDLVERSSNPSIVDRFRFGLSNSADVWGSMGNGIQLMLEGQPLQVSTNRWYWAATRVLAEPPVNSGNAITEMPYFTFLYGDLHAHMISMPMQLLILLFLLHEVLNAGRSERRRLPTVLAIATDAIAVGMLQATNTWDWPTYLLLSVLGLGFVWWLKWERFNRASIVDMFLRIGGFITLSVWLSMPYTKWYAAIYGSASLWQGNKTPIWAYLIIHGLFLFLLLSLLIWESWRWLRSVRVRELRGLRSGMYTALGVVTGVVFVSFVLSVYEWRVSIFLIPMLVWTIALFFRPYQTRSMQFLLVLAAVAIGVTLGVEYIVIDGDIGRQNTVFKFYLQGWLMYSIVGGVAVAWLLDNGFEWHVSIRAFWLVALAVLVGTAALYPLMSTQARAIDRMAPQIGVTLDGMDYMQEAQHFEVTNSSLGQGEVIDLVHDYNVIHWLQDNVEGTPVIMEAQSEAEYRWGSRMSIYTGMPSVIGWNWHQRQQRTFDPMPRMVQQRVANVNAFYTTTDISVASNILQHYGVEYVIVSSLERARYPSEGIDKLYDMVELGVLEIVYEDDGGVGVVFAVNQQAAQALALNLTDVVPVVRAN